MENSYVIYGEYMSRIGNKPITIPPNVRVDIDGCNVVVSGEKGVLSQSFNPAMNISVDDGILSVSRPTDSREHRQQATADRVRQPASKAQWEYKSIFGDSRVALEEEMNQFGQDGWEFFNITSFGRGSAAFARRPIGH